MKPDKIPPAPAHLSPAARQHWADILATWQFSPVELLALRGALESWDLAGRFRAELDDAETLSVETGAGMVRQHPAVKGFLDASREARLAFASLKLEMPEEGRWMTIAGSRGVA